MTRLQEAYGVSIHLADEFIKDNLFVLRTRSGNRSLLLSVLLHNLCLSLRLGLTLALLIRSAERNS
jgi:hypothetical protein